MDQPQPSIVHYTGEVWNGPAVHPDLWALLHQKNILIELSGGSPPYQVVVGVPHHAAPGVARIADAWTNPLTGKKGRPADETTGLTGLAVFTALQDMGISSKLVIAAHSLHHDPNKTPDSSYWQSIFSNPLPNFLLELHGAGRTRRHMLELSAGRNDITDPLTFGLILLRYLDKQSELAVQARPGSSEARLFQPHLHSSTRLQNPALNTDSLTYAGNMGILALHLEMKSYLRQPDPAFPDAPRPSVQAWQLALALAKTIRAAEFPGGIYIPASDLGMNSAAYLTGPSPRHRESFMAAIQESDHRDPYSLDDLSVEIGDNLMQLFYQWDGVAADGPGPGDDEDPPLREEILWLIDQEEFIGRAFIFHWLNDFRRETDGQVDYWIRPSRRRQGYGKLILRLLLERFRQIGNERILVTCNSDNQASRKIIESNGGIFESEIADALSPTGLRRRYWIHLD
jgi:GNAT superfamily N-acetyltransferase